jgi:hypothetical protein
MTGANFLSPKMEPPDTMDVSMRLENLLFTWNAAFGNRHYGETDDVVGGNKVPQCQSVPHLALVCLI